MTIYRSQSGFTSIELMAVVTLIGVLAAISIPQYQIYVAKTQTSRIINDLGQLRLPIEVCLQTDKYTIGGGENNCDPKAIGVKFIEEGSLTGATLSGGIATLQISNSLTDTTKMVATVTPKAAPSIANKKVLWSRSREGMWHCSSSIAVMYLPGFCSHDDGL